MSSLVRFAGAALFCLSICAPTNAIRKTPSPNPLKQLQHIPVLFENASGSKIRAELVSVKVSNAEEKPGQLEKRWIGAYGRARFITGKVSELLNFSVYQNGNKVRQQSFGPFSEKTQRKIKWDGSALILAD